MENKKFEFTEETKTTSWGVVVKRIVALRDFGDVKVGDKGGFLEKEENLSHDNDCWVYDEALVCGQALVYGQARVFNKVLVCDEAQVYGQARVCDEAQVYGQALVYGQARVYGQAQVCDEARVITVVKTFGNGFGYRITVTDKHIKIGCQQHLKSEWYNFQEEEIIAMDGKKALKFWRIFKPLAEQLGLFEEI